MGKGFSEASVIQLGGAKAVCRRGAGRPTREQSEQRHQDLLDGAIAMFLEKGYDTLTMEGVAASVGTSKRTLYGRYPDKGALFRAAVEHAIERWLTPIADYRALEVDSLELTLTAIARARLKDALSPAGIRLHQLIDTQARKFPDIYDLVHDRGTLPLVRYLAEVFSKHSLSGEIRPSHPEQLATGFISLVVVSPANGRLWGVLDQAAADERMLFYLELFLNGARQH